MAPVPFQELFLEELRSLVRPLAAAASDVRVLPDDPAGRFFPYGVWRVLEEMGLARRLPGDPFQTLPPIVSALQSSLSAIPTTAPRGNDMLAAAKLLASVDDVVRSLTTLADVPESDLTVEEVARRLWGWLLWKRVAGISPILAAVGETTGVVRSPFLESGPYIDVESMRRVLVDPRGLLLERIGWGTNALDTAVVFSNLSVLFDALGFTTSFVELSDKTDEAALVGLRVAIVRGFDEVTGIEFETGIELRANDAAEPSGVLVRAYGEGALEAFVPASNRVAVKVSTDALAETLPELSISPQGVTATGSTGSAKGELRFDTRIVGPPLPNGASGTRDDVTILSLAGLGGITARTLSMGTTIFAHGEAGTRGGLHISLDGAIAHFAPAEVDGFLAQILKGQGFETPFDMALRWAPGSGLTFEGTAGIDVDVPVGLSFDQALAIDVVHLGAELGNEAFAFELTVTGGAKLGPFSVSVSRLGLLSAIDAGKARSGGDLNLGDLLPIAFKPPNGLGLGLDLGPVGGGGILDLDVEAGRYAGAMQLAVEAVKINAFGVILTKMPDGSEGFSMLAFMRGEFAPIQLGFGFTLNAVGGLLGIHRDLDARSLFAAVRAGRAGDLLAPEDPIRDAPTLIAQAETIFPPRRGRHVFGPTMQIGWGAPRSLIKLDLALALTVPEPLRILMIGRVRAVLPDETVKLVALNLDVAGILDLSRGTFDLEGRLFDSVIQAIPITGGFAMKTAWGARRSFIFSVGGLHPRFAPPTGFPVLPRAGVDLSKSANFNLRLSAYFAVSSNSLQLGAAVDLLAKMGKYGLEAHLGFDALLILDPFELDAELRASARIFRGSRTLMRLSLKARLRGPGPWRINGSVTFEIFWVDVTLRVSKSFGTPVPRDSPRVALVPIFEAALAAPANWASEGTGPLILARGATGVVPGRTLVFSQRDLPLDFDLEQYGGLEIADRRRFEITGADMGGRTAARAAVRPREAFAIGSVLKLSEDERLVAPDFQELPSGMSVEGTSITDDGTQAEAPAERRILRIDARTGDDAVSSFSEQRRWSPPAATLTRARAHRPLVTIRPERWMAGPVDATTAGPFDSWAEARAASPDGTVSRWHEGRAA